MELERIQAEESVESLTKETSDYKKVLNEQLLEKENSKLEAVRKNEGILASLSFGQLWRGNWDSVTSELGCSVY